MRSPSALPANTRRAEIRFNAVAPGVVDSPLHAGAAKDSLGARTPMGTYAEPRDIAGAVAYLAQAAHITGEVLRVDDGAHVGRW